MKIQQLLDNWTTATISVKRCQFSATNKELKFFSLHYNHEGDYYYIKYQGITYGMENVVSFSPNTKPEYKTKALKKAYDNGFNDGVEAAANDIALNPQKI